MSTSHAHEAAYGQAHDAHGHDHPWYLGHHWQDPKQQFEAGKLGMWLFLATEVLLFGGLFVGYSVWRSNHPELFKYGSQFLDTKWGAINTCVLILSSLTMAWAVTAAQQGKQGLLKLMLSLTLLGAMGFLAIKYVEYKHKFDEGYFPGLKFYSQPGPHSHTWVSPGSAGHGSPEVGGGAGVAPHADAAAVGAVVGEGLDDHASGLTPAPGADSTTPSTAPAATAQADPTIPPVDAPQIAPAAVGPSGLKQGADLIETPFEFSERHHTAHVHPLQDPERPPNAHMFFNIYFMMTGLHGVHVVIGMIVITWLLVGAIRGRFGADYFTPVDLGGLYWHIVDLIWIFLFPLFYLI